MKRLLFDTSVIVAGTIKNHPHHSLAFPWIKNVQQNKITGFVSTHALAETYSVLTKLPISPALNPQFVNDFINNEILKNFACIDLSSKDYRTALALMARQNLKGGIIYDGLHYMACLKKNLDGLVTFNERDFRKFDPAKEFTIIDVAN